MSLFLGITIPFIGTLLGAAVVFFMQNKISSNVEKSFLGFASGVMVAASVWSLLIPSLEMATSQGIISWIPAVVGFMFGIIFLLLLDNIIPHLHLKGSEPEGPKSNISKSMMMILAVTLHNIPEGMAVGVALAGAMALNSGITMASAIALSIGIAIQNFPEGAIVSMPLKEEMGKKKAFFYGMLSGVVEPIGAVITILLTSLVVPVLPYLLSFAAGAMIYVVVEELIPESQQGKHSNLGTLGFSVGFLLMMVLDTIF